jgi:hypothetical protein
MTAPTQDRKPAPHPLRRVLLVLVVVAGVLAMHGLSATHSGIPPAGKATHPMAGTGLARHVGDAAHTADAGASLGVALGMGAAGMAAERAHVHFGDMCLAVLTVLLILVAARRGSRRSTRAAAAVGLVAKVALRAPPPGPPSLSQLCISRT